MPGTSSTSDHASEMAAAAAASIAARQPVLAGASTTASTTPRVMAAPELMLSAPIAAAGANNRTGPIDQNEVARAIARANALTGGLTGRTVEVVTACQRCSAPFLRPEDAVKLRPCECVVCKDCLIDFLTASLHFVSASQRQQAPEQRLPVLQAINCCVCSEPAKSHTRKKWTAQPNGPVVTQPFFKPIPGSSGTKRKAPTDGSAAADDDTTDTDSDEDTSYYKSKPEKWAKIPFEDRLKALKMYKREHGNCLVPNSHPFLGDWVRNVRHERVAVDKEQRRLLDRVGFEWEHTRDKRQRKWLEDLERLKDFQREFGHTRVPETYHRKPDDDPKLCSLHGWSRTQRKNHKAGVLREDRQQILEEINFEFNPGGDRGRISAAAEVPPPEDEDEWDRY